MVVVGLCGRQQMLAQKVDIGLPVVYYRDTEGIIESSRNTQDRFAFLRLSYRVATLYALLLSGRFLDELAGPIVPFSSGEKHG